MLESCCKIMIIQNAPNSWTQWFYTNAPAAWFSAAAAVTTLALVLRSRKRPKRLVVREVSNSSLIQVWPGIRHQITVAFEGNPIDGLGQLDLELFNTGSDLIEDASFTLVLSKGTHILGCLSRPEHAKVTTEINDNIIKVVLPFLNPVKEHGHIVSISILVEDQADILTVTGMGHGWSLKYSALPTEKRVGWYLGSMLGFLVLFATGGLFYPRYLEKHFGIGANELSPRVLVAVLPIVALGALMIFVMNKIARVVKARGFRKR
jgi:hypothetical protein